MSYKRGDLIEVVNGDSMIKGCYDRTECGFIKVTAQGDPSHMNIIPLDGAQVTVVKHSGPPLPMWPGFYLNAKGKLWTLEEDGTWRDDYDSYCDEEEARWNAPFTRLDTAPETAERVLRALEEVLTISKGRYVTSTMVEWLAWQFGVKGWKA